MVVLGALVVVLRLGLGLEWEWEWELELEFVPMGPGLRVELALVLVLVVGLALALALVLARMLVPRVLQKRSSPGRYVCLRLSRQILLSPYGFCVGGAFPASRRCATIYASSIGVRVAAQGLNRGLVVSRQPVQLRESLPNVFSG